MDQGALRVAILAVDCFERGVRLRLPFRFGHATLREARQAYVRAIVALPDGTRAEGWSAELMIPKWFDKSPERSDAGNVDDLRLALATATRAYVDGGPLRTAFGHAAAHYRAILATGERARLNPLVASYGPALVDRAILDAIARARGVALFEAIRSNLPGIDASLTPEIDDEAIGATLRSAAAPVRIAVRHTVGLLDPIEAGTVGERPDDDLPVALTEVVTRYRPRYFKLKLAGDPGDDVARLARIATVLDQQDDYRVTFDGNEQYADLDSIDRLFADLARERRCARLLANLLYLEQPLPRDRSLLTPFEPGRFAVPLVVDEADSTLEAFPRARAAGYRGVSSKDCKGFYKSLLNAARCRMWNADRPGHWFLTAEDLTAQPGLAVQQDLALASLLGLGHVERNGHHYANGFAAQQAPAAERNGFLAAHPGLYERDGDNVRLAIHDGEIDIRSLRAPGFGTGFLPDPAWLSPMALPAPPEAAGLPATP